MRVLISGYYGFHNIGDEAILKSMISSLQYEEPDIQITVLSNDVEYTQNTYNVEAINRWDLRQIYKELKKSDGLISGGGSLFQDITSSRSIWYYSLIIFLAKLARKPIFIYAQGVGPINKYFNKKIVKLTFNNADYITLRDEESKLLINSIGVDKYIEIVPDPVMGFELNEDKNLNKEIDKYNKYVIVSVREWKHSKHDIFDDIAKVCDEIVENGINIIFMPMHGKYDENISIYISKKMKYDSLVLPSDLSIEDKMIYINKSILMIGMRLHALIFSAMVGTPMIGISYDPKIDSYLKIFNQDSIGNMNEGFDTDKLVNKSMDIIKNYDKEKKGLEFITSRLKKSAKLTARKVIEIFEKV